MFIHIDMDYFFAQAEELRHPELRGRIIAVCVFSGRTKDSGVISTVNYEGRKYGIRSGQPIYQAKRKAPPDSVFLPVDHAYYGELSDRIDSIVREFGTKSERTSVDEWFVEVEGDAPESARKLKEEIRKQTGMACSVGVAPSMLGSKMAADKSKPDGLLVLDEKGERMLVENSDAQKVVGIGAKTAEALHSIGVEKVRDLKGIDPVALVEMFGKNAGGWLVALAEGRYEGLLEYGEGEQSEVSRVGTLKERTRDAGELLEKINGMEKDNKDWLKANRKHFKTLVITFITEDMRSHTRSFSFRNPMGAEADLREEEMKIIRDFLEEIPLSIRRIGIKYANLVDVTGQSTLAGEFD